MLIAILILFITAIVLLVYNPLPEKIFGGHNYPEIQEIQEEIHQYSGLHRDYYMSYYTNMDMAKRTNDSSYVSQAVEDLRNISLMIKEPDSDIPEQINALADKLHITWLKRKV